MGEDRPNPGLGSLLRPRVIAVVGASRDPAKWGRRVLESTSRAGFRGALYGVNPAVSDLGLPSAKTVASLADIGGPVDLAVLARPAAATPALIEECAELGVGSVLITASGFGELGGDHLAAELRMCAVAKAAGMRLLGPNTFGMFVASAGVNLTPREGIPAGSVALLTQSGNVAVAMYELARQAGIGFSACVGVGNQIDVGLGELMAHFAGDPGTAAIAVYVEGLRGSGAAFRAGLEACRAAAKPVVVLKGGRTAHAAPAITTHTGALASDGRVWQAVLDAAGVIAVESIQDLTDVLAVVTSVRPHAGRAAIITDGGGDTVMAIDAVTGAARAGPGQARGSLSLAVPSAATWFALDELIPPNAPRTPARNPVTLDTAGGVEDDPMLLARCARVAAADDGVDVIVIGGLFGGYPKIVAGEVACADDLVALHNSAKPVIVQSAFALASPEPIRRLREGGIAVLPTIDRLARALARTVLRAQPAAARPPATSAASSAVLPAGQTASLLREHGIELPPMTVVADQAELADIAATASYPACLKIADTSVSHKSDVGGVVLNLADAAALRSAADRLWQRFPGSPLLVMPSLPTGTELLVGTGHDALFGPFVLVGRGGIWAETDPDVAISMAPCTEAEAERALLSLRCAATFTGARGTKPIDIAAVARLIAALSRLAVAHPELSVEANPVIAYADGYAVADLRASARSGQREGGEEAD
jgi:acetate---CoA ligase (ADP-forming)